MALTPISSSRPWSDLPRDLLSKIGKTLDTRIDVLRFRSVCSSWRSSDSSSSKPSQYSIKLPFPIFPFNNYNPNRRGHFLVTESIIYALQPLTEIREIEPKIWVIKVPAESSKPGKVILKVDPLSKLCAVDFPRVLNLLDYKIVEISKVHELEFIDETENPILDRYGEMMFINSIKRVAINFSSLEKVIDDSFVIMVLHSNGKVAIWRNADAKWFKLRDNSELTADYDDVVFHDGRFFAANRNGRTLIVDPVSLPQSMCFGTEWPDSHCWMFNSPKRFFVKSLGNLFSIVKKDDKYCEDYQLPVYKDDDCEDDRLTVYKFNEERSDWVKVDGLNDRAFIITYHNSFSLSSADFAGLIQGNFVYYSSWVPPDVYHEDDDDEFGYMDHDIDSDFDYSID